LIWCWPDLNLASFGHAATSCSYITQLHQAAKMLLPSAMLSALANARAWNSKAYICNGPWLGAQHWLPSSYFCRPPMVTRVCRNGLLMQTTKQVCWCMGVHGSHTHEGILAICTHACIGGRQKLEDGSPLPLTMWCPNIRDIHSSIHSSHAP
jgi:hypothetical protein